MSADLYATAARYNVQFSGDLVDGTYHDGVDYADQMTLAEVAKAGGKVTRIRLLAERGIADISYIHATLPGGKIVPVVDHPGQVRMRERKGAMIEWAKRSRVFAKGLGLLDESNYAVLYG